MKIKTFRFNGCKTNYINGKHIKINDSNIDIDNCIMGFLKENNAELIDVKIVPIECMQHNNGGYNNIDLIYTIIYKEIKK